MTSHVKCTDCGWNCETGSMDGWSCGRCGMERNGSWEVWWEREHFCVWDLGEGEGEREWVRVEKRVTVMEMVEEPELKVEWMVGGGGVEWGEVGGCSGGAEEEGEDGGGVGVGEAFWAGILRYLEYLGVG